MSTPQFSILIYVKKDVLSAQRFLSDSQSFFSKFQIPFQVLIASNLGNFKAQEKLKKAILEKAPAVSTQVFFFPQAKGRAQTLMAALQSSFHHDLVLLADATLSTPLADLLKLLQELIQNPSVEAAWGDRTKHKSKPLQNQKSKRLKLENFFTPVLLEKNSNHSFADPLCEVGALRTSKINFTELKDVKSSSWYLQRWLQRVLPPAGPLPVAIADSGAPSLDYNAFKEKILLTFT